MVEAPDSGAASDTAASKLNGPATTTTAAHAGTIAGAPAAPAPPAMPGSSPEPLPSSSSSPLPPAPTPVAAQHQKQPQLLAPPTHGWFGRAEKVGRSDNNNKCDRIQDGIDDSDLEDDDGDDDDADDREQSDSMSNRTTDAQTMMHILKANIGTGVLAMPLAFKNVGLWLGLVLVPVIGVICIHCMNILIASHNNLCDRFNYESLDYDQVAALGLACGPRWARRLAKRTSFIVTTFLMFTQIGFCCVYILFTVENLQVACFNLFQLDYSLITYLIVVFPVIGLTSCTSNLKHLARISTLANILQLFGLALIFYDLLQFHTYAPEAPAIRVEQGLSMDIGTGLPLFFATAVYAFEGIGVVLPLVKEMQQPARISGLNGVLNTSMSLVAILYMAIGFLGYAKYGQTVAGSITLNLPEATHNELVRLAFALAIGLSYSLQFYVPWTIVWPLIDEALFYSYRPRKSRNKLSILSKLSAENQWAIHEVILEKEQRQRQQLSASVRRRPGSSVIQNEANEAANDNSTATTLATSYSMSMSTQQQRFAPASMGKAREFNWQQYGTIKDADDNDQVEARSVPAGVGGGGLKQVASQAQNRRQRNRLDDMRDPDSDDDTMPDVQWRPPPRSMRGKRKLVRYSVILLTVSFTFVAAALIPRLDLFISLIGALASSSLAIIFPAIIQMCTFWNYDHDHAHSHQGRNEHDVSSIDDDIGDIGDIGKDKKGGPGRRAASSGPEACACNESGETLTKTSSLLLSSAAHARSQPAVCRRHCAPAKRRTRSRRKLRKQIMWYLFVCKNIFLLMFGVLGLITGTWVSLRQLGVATV